MLVKAHMTRDEYSARRSEASVAFVMIVVLNKDTFLYGNQICGVGMVLDKDNRLFQRYRVRYSSRNGL